MLGKVDLQVNFKKKKQPNKKNTTKKHFPKIVEGTEKVQIYIVYVLYKGFWFKRKEYQQKENPKKI